jgi:hypothetical protein
MPTHTLERVDCFSVFAAADPSVLPRILDVFCLFGLIPERCHSALGEAEGGQLTIDIQIAGLTAEDAERLAKRLRRVLTVTQVLWSEKRRAAA